MRRGCGSPGVFRQAAREQCGRWRKCGWRRGRAADGSRPPSKLAGKETAEALPRTTAIGLSVEIPLQAGSRFHPRRCEHKELLENARNRSMRGTLIINLWRESSCQWFFVPSRKGMDRSMYVSVNPSFVIPRPARAEKETVREVEPLPSEEAASRDAPCPESAAEEQGVAEQQQGVKKRKADEPKEKLSLKRRHQKTHPDKEDRLCGFIGRGEACPYQQCQYSHDVFSFLSKKPADLGPSCVVFEKYGYCPSGIMCRYGDSHIDRANGRNLSRPEEAGGIVERKPINLLRKASQLLLRKRNLKELCNSSSTPFPDQPVKLVDFRNKVYVAPLTTVGNMPFRRVMKDFGADITCGEMAMATNILQGQNSEWALMRRHESEDVFGIQVAGPYPNVMADVAQVLEHETESDFVDLNCACPIDVVYSRGSGSALMQNHKRLCDIVKTMAGKLRSRSVTVKVRIGHDEKAPTTHKLIPMLQSTAPGRMAAIMIHGRSKLQRYHKLANWNYVLQCAQAQDPSLPLIPIIGNGDIFSFEDWRQHLHMMTDSTPPPTRFVLHQSEETGATPDAEVLGLCSCAMLGRGALIKPWLPLEIKEQRLLDISASQRLDMLRSFCNYGLEHWGSDEQGVATTRRFLLEWLSFLHRYVPAGLLEHKAAASSEVLPTSTTTGRYLGQALPTIDYDVHVQTMSQRPPHYFGRCDLETLLSSSQSVDWIRISEMLLGPVAKDFLFIPKHKSNSYAAEVKASPAGGQGAEGEAAVGVDEDDNNG